MLSIYDNHTEPCWNLAAEEYLLDRFDVPVLRLWQNSDSIIVGRHQNTWAETDVRYVRSHNIPVVRRLTGGGTVFHDLGNLNWSFFNLKGAEAAGLVVTALDRLGIKAGISGRNDITADGAKISGTASARRGSHTLEHGTLLFDTSMETLSAALSPRPEKFQGKSINSVKSRVSNIRDLLPHKMEMDAFRDQMARLLSQGGSIYRYTGEDLEAIEGLRAGKYATEEWNFGHNPDCRLNRVARTSAGLVETHLNVENGVISHIEIYGDYLSDIPSEKLCRLLEGCPHTPEKTTGLLRKEQVGMYLGGITPEELLPLLF